MATLVHRRMAMLRVALRVYSEDANIGSDIPLGSAVSNRASA
jgi:hypothetical protein